jgi:hypothetical protein
MSAEVHSDAVRRIMEGDENANPQRSWQFSERLLGHLLSNGPGLFQADRSPVHARPEPI